VIENIVDALLRVPAITGAAALALVELPQGTEYPAVVYSVVSDVPMESLCGPATAFSARVQVNPLAASMTAINALHAAIKTAMESDVKRVVAGKAVRFCRLTGYGPTSKDEYTGMWTKPADYQILYE